MKGRRGLWKDGGRYAWREVRSEGGIRRADGGKEGNADSLPEVYCRLWDLGVPYFAAFFQMLKFKEITGIPVL